MQRGDPCPHCFGKYNDYLAFGPSGRRYLQPEPVLNKLSRRDGERICDDCAHAELMTDSYYQCNADSKLQQGELDIGYRKAVALIRKRKKSDELKDLCPFCGSNWVQDLTCVNCGKVRRLSDILPSAPSPGSGLPAS